MLSSYGSSFAALSTVRCSDPEQVTGLLPDMRRRFLPLVGNFDFFQTKLQLGDLLLVFERRPPCASEGFLDERHTGIALSMGDLPGLALDGWSLDQPALVSHGSAIPHRFFHPSDLAIAAVVLPDTRGNRGWPERAKASKVSPIQPSALHQLRAVVGDILGLASRDPPRFSQEKVVSGMRQSLLGTIDHAFLTAPGEKPAGMAIGNYVRICRIADEFIRSSPKDLPSSAKVAAAAGATIRTLHNAMVAVNGMSLQKFMILNRLWAVRAALMRAPPEALVKTIAFDHGFWHLGRFSQTYRTFFGESPSDTLGRARAA